MRRRRKPKDRIVTDRCGLTRKARYSTQSVALAALAMLRRQAELRGHRQERREYKCWYCGGWHLTSQEARV